MRTVPRDCGGFALYFGTYTYLRTRLLAPVPEQAAMVPAPAPVESAVTVVTRVLPELLSALTAGSAAGMVTYLWRSPWDTLYKKHMGWRPVSAPLLSSSRFITSPRGLKAMAISGVT